MVRLPVLRTGRQILPRLDHDFADVVRQSEVGVGILRKRGGSRWMNITIGPFKEYFGLADARKKARSILLDIENGKGATRPAKED